MKAPSGSIGTGLRKDVQDMLDRTWPDGVVELSIGPEDSYFCDLHPKLSRALRSIRKTSLGYEREAFGDPVWFEGSDPEEDPPDDIEQSRSYHTFFVTPDGEAFTFETEAEGLEEPDDFEEGELDEDPPVSLISGTGTTGWVVAVSLLAPVAVIELGFRVIYEDGTATEPGIGSYAETADDGQVDREDDFRKVHGARAYKTLVSLRAKIVDLLKGFGITVLPVEEWRKPAPGLRGSEETLIGFDGGPIRVLDAFFFASL
jgi:hypothetical protein